MSSDSISIIEHLQQWGACDISSMQAFCSLCVADGLSKLNYPNGGFLEGLVMQLPQFQAGQAKIVGQAFAVKFVPKSDISAPKLQGNSPLPHVNAVYGGLKTLRAQKLKAAGVVIDGRVRDLGEHQALNFPLFARSVGTTAGGEVCRPSEVNVPVRLNSSDQDAWIYAGDYIIAVMNGVVRLPHELAEQVLDIIPAIAEADAKCAEAIKDGMSVHQAFKEFRGR
ncbi:ribonuclease E inhibitor RraA/Dimethylmenaquinone methyltransferase [Aspergillus caelatus]|uniref:Ribonuclease E inhibitor RraA/Dimethylmenaquinone methyltransferase n=1 Tax=Aspergillus caelatus TaxID=61420 RepID=A0A5N7AJ12_9EURO|nr:ribonuclease E inhibitor RraA/Dimethylmenaquinone methyltransferase [Aspergillus caelatus]KAE8368999.1 ribonuclease E inhibitor RraA/Dimethylmenaquinone methyltransferase [Aspergillus caelatus]